MSINGLEKTSYFQDKYHINQKVLKTNLFYNISKKNFKRGPLAAVRRFKYVKYFKVH